MPSFAIVKNQRVLATMDKFYIGRINSVLQEQNIQTLIYPSDEGTVPIILENNIKILFYQEYKPDFDTKFECLTGPTFLIEPMVVKAQYSVAPLGLEDAKSQIRERVKCHRRNGLNKYVRIALPLAPVVLSPEFSFSKFVLDTTSVITDISDETVSRLSANQTVTGFIKWKFKDRWLDLCAEDIVFLLNSINNIRQECFDKEYSLIRRINDANDFGDLKVIYDELNTLESGGASNVRSSI